MASDYFCPAYRLDETSRQVVADWAGAQDWPAGTELKKPAGYHITALFSPSGYAERSHHDWLTAQPTVRFCARAEAVCAFAPGEGDTMVPVVLTFQNLGLTEHALALRAAAQARGLPVVHFPGGYKAHVTVAFCPTDPRLPAPAKLLIDVEGPYEHHAHMDALKRLARTREAVQDAVDLGAQLLIDYTNHRGVRAQRVVRPERVYVGDVQWHPGSQPLLDAWDIEKAALRTFALADIHRFATLTQ